MPAPGSRVMCLRHPDRYKLAHALCAACVSLARARGMAGRPLTEEELPLLDLSPGEAKRRLAGMRGQAAPITTISALGAELVGSMAEGTPTVWGAVLVAGEAVIAPAPFSDEPELRAQLAAVGDVLEAFGVDPEDKCPDDAAAIRQRFLADAATIATLRGALDDAQAEAGATVARLQQALELTQQEKRAAVARLRDRLEEREQEASALRSRVTEMESRDADRERTRPAVTLSAAVLLELGLPLGTDEGGVLAELRRRLRGALTQGDLEARYVMMMTARALMARALGGEVANG